MRRNVTFPIDDRYQTDETDCEQWPCNNIYTRCNDFWNCPNSADELNWGNPFSSLSFFTDIGRRSPFRTPVAMKQSDVRNEKSGRSEYKTPDVRSESRPDVRNEKYRVFVR